MRYWLRLLNPNLNNHTHTFEDKAKDKVLKSDKIGRSQSVPGTSTNRTKHC